MNTDVQKRLLEAAKDPNLTMERAMTEILRVVIIHSVEHPGKVNVYDLGNVLAGASKGLEAGGPDETGAVLQQLRDFVGDE